MPLKNDEEYELTNREKTNRPRKGKFWCGKCDAAKRYRTGKCPNCGVKNKK